MDRERYTGAAELDLSALRRIPPLPKGEAVIMLVRRHPAVLSGPILLFACAFTASIVVGVKMKHGEWLLFCWVASAVLFIRLFWRLYRWFTEYYMITARRIQRYYGMLRRKDEWVPLSRLTAIKSRQSISGRLFAFSHLTFESACADRPVLRFDYAPYPERLLQQLRESAFLDVNVHGRGVRILSRLGMLP
jgi:uncharacterized membrane protein YdbT with pleckstrin-like domain